MKNLKIARRYARALLLMGKEDGQAETYGEELKEFAEVLQRDKGLEMAVTNPIYNAQDRKRVLEKVTGKLQVSKVMTSFLLLLFDKGRVRFVGPINELYQRYVDELKGVARAGLVTASDLSSESVERIRQALSKYTGKDVVLEVEKNPTLIGGIVTTIGDLVLDGSIRTQLLNMKETLKRSETV